MTITKAPKFHTYTPLWENPHLPELQTVSDYKLWIARGVIFLSQVIVNGTITSFQALKDGFDLPNHMFFRYLQLRHALNSQFRDSVPSLDSLYLVDPVMGQDPKKRISTFYNHLLPPAATDHAYQLKTKWESDLGL